MHVKKRSGGWYVCDVPPYQVDGEEQHDYGPYETKAEADSDRLGVQRFMKKHPELFQGEKR